MTGRGSHHPRVVLVTGGTGAVGPAVLRALRGAPGQVRCVARHRPCPADTIPDVDYLTGDLTDLAEVRRFAADVDVVVHLAGLAHRTRPTPDEVRRYRTLNVDATVSLIDAVPRGCRFVLASTIAVYGPTSSRTTVDEESIPRPDTPYAQSKLEAEQMLWARHRTGQVAGVVLRLAAVYGPHVTGNYRTLLGAVGRGLPIAFGSGTNVRTLVHEDDLAECVRLAASHPAAVGGTFNVTDGRLHTLAEVLVAMYAAAGRRPPRHRVPDWALTAVARVHDLAVGRLSGRLLGPLVAKYSESCAVDGLRAQQQLGYRPRVGLTDGWRRTWLELSHQERVLEASH